VSICQLLYSALASYAFKTRKERWKKTQQTRALTGWSRGRGRGVNHWRERCCSVVVEDCDPFALEAFRRVSRGLICVCARGNKVGTYIQYPHPWCLRVMRTRDRYIECLSGVIWFTFFGVANFFFINSLWPFNPRSVPRRWSQSSDTKIC